MRSLVPLTLLGILLIGTAGCGGCGRAKSPPMAAGAANLQGSSLATGNIIAANPADPVHQGRTASQWADRLSDPQLAAGPRFEASKALEGLGDVATPYLINAMKNAKSPEVRLAAMEALTPVGMAKNEQQLAHLFLDLLKDRNDVVREQAAARLAWFDQTTPGRPVAGYMAKERLMALQATYYFDNNSAVRLAARNSLLSVYDHMRGRLDCPPVQDIFIDKPAQ